MRTDILNYKDSEDNYKCARLLYTDIQELIEEKYIHSIDVLGNDRFYINWNKTKQDVEKYLGKEMSL